MAEATRGRIVASARTLFARHGIDRVTIAAVAARASVATPTVYALFKSKEGLLQAIMRESLFGQPFAIARKVMDGVDDAVAQIALTANIARAIYESESSDLGLIRGASAFSPTLRRIEAEFETLRFAMQEARVAALFAQGKARPQLDIDQARRILWMYTSRDVYRMLVAESGWTAQAYQDWLARTLLEALVKDQAKQLRRFGKSSSGLQVE